MSPEDLFLAWLIALPERVDPAVAAVRMLTAMRRLDAPSPDQARLAELFRQVTPFADSAPRRRVRASRPRLAVADFGQPAPV